MWVNPYVFILDLVLQSDYKKFDKINKTKMASIILFLFPKYFLKKCYLSIVICHMSKIFMYDKMVVYIRFVNFNSKMKLYE